MIRALIVICLAVVFAATAKSPPPACGCDCGTPKPEGGYSYKSGAETFPYQAHNAPKGKPL